MRLPKLGLLPGLWLLAAPAAWSQAENPPPCGVVQVSCTAPKLPDFAHQADENTAELKRQLAQEKARQRQRAERQSIEAGESSDDALKLDQVVVVGQVAKPTRLSVAAAIDKFLALPPLGPSRYESPDGVVTECVTVAWGRLCGSTTPPGQMPKDLRPGMMHWGL
jgi:hypothetical protein